MQHPNLGGERLRALRDRLLGMRRDLEGRARRMDASGLDTSLSDSLGELSTYDNHPADIGGELFERSKDLALKGLLRRRIRQVDHALDLMRAGMYGLCERCGRPIPLERLDAEPSATLCVDCQRLQDAAAGFPGRPAEEDVLDRSLRRLFGDAGGDGNTAYDGEDAWQEVERHGTSGSPQDDPDVTGYDEPFMRPDEPAGAVQPVEEIPDPRAVADLARVEDAGAEGDGDGGGGAEA